MSDHPEEFIPGIWVSEQVAETIDKHPDFKGIRHIANLPTGDLRDRAFVAPGAFKDLPKKVPFKNEAGDVIGEALVSEVDGEILMEIDIDPENPEAKYFNTMLHVSKENNNG